MQGLIGSNDHNSGKLAIGPDSKLYFTSGDLGANQFGNKCNPIRSQNLPTAAELTALNYINYQGKILRMELSGAIPTDNPTLSGVKSDVYSYGHRNPQGIVFGSDGTLYSNEHGPKTDDEVNVIQSAKNYGWPRVAGFRNDNSAYVYCNWSTIANCTNATFSDLTCGTGATQLAESTFTATDYLEPIQTFFSVANGYDFSGGYLTWPGIAPSSLKIYESSKYTCPIPGWNNSLLSTSLKKGRVFRSKLSADLQSVDVSGGAYEELFATDNNRFRCLAVAPDGRNFFVITDSSGSTSGPTSGGVGVQNPGVIIKYAYRDAVTSSATTNAYGAQFTANWQPYCTATSYQLDVFTQGVSSGVTTWNFDGTSTAQATTGINGNNLKNISTNTTSVNFTINGVTTASK